MTSPPALIFAIGDNIEQSVQALQADGFSSVREAQEAVARTSVILAGLPSRLWHAHRHTKRHAGAVLPSTIGWLRNLQPLGFAGDASEGSSARTLLDCFGYVREGTCRTCISARHSESIITKWPRLGKQAAASIRIRTMPHHPVRKLQQQLAKSKSSRISMIMARVGWKAAVASSAGCFCSVARIPTPAGFTGGWPSANTQHSGASIIRSLISPSCLRGLVLDTSRIVCHTWMAAPEALASAPTHQATAAAPARGHFSCNRYDNVSGLEPS